MDQPIVQGLLTFLGGAVVAGLNALLSARLLDKKPAAFASFSAVRQLFNVAYLVLVFFVISSPLIITSSIVIRSQSSKIHFCLAP